MYEDRTRENLKREMLEELDESSGLNTLEGGYADQTFGPMAVKLEEFYGALRAMAMFAMVDETCGGMIDIAAGNYSVTRKPGVAATAMVHFVGSGGAHIPAETIFSTASGLCYTLKNSVTLNGEGHGDGLLIAETVGSRYNVTAGMIDRNVKITKVKYLNGYWIALCTGSVFFYRRATSPMGTWSVKVGPAWDSYGMPYPLEDIFYGNGYWVLRCGHMTKYSSNLTGDSWANTGLPNGAGSANYHSIAKSEATPSLTIIPLTLEAPTTPSMPAI